MVVAIALQLSTNMVI